MFSAWGQPGRQIREEGTAKALEAAGLAVQRIVSSPAAGSDPNLLTPILSSAFGRSPDTKLIVLAGGQTMASVPQYMKAIGKQPGEVSFIGFDLNPSVLEAIKGGYIFAFSRLRRSSCFLCFCFSSIIWAKPKLWRKSKSIEKKYIKPRSGGNSSHENA